MDSKSQGQAGPVPGDAACLRGAAPSSCWIPIARRKPFPFTKGRGPGAAASSAGRGPEGLAAAGTAHPWTAGRAEAAAGTSGGGAGPAAPGSGSNRLREKGSASDSGEQSPETELEPYSGPLAALGPCPPHQGPPGEGRSPAGAPGAASRSPGHHGSPPSPGLRARMASLRQGCGDLRGLVSTFTQSCQGSLSEAQGQVSWALGALSADGAGTQLAEAPQGPLPGCPGRLLELKGNIRVLCRLRPGTPSSLVSLEPGPGGTVTTCYRGHQRRFRLDWVFPPHASQEEVFRELESAVLSCLGGYSVCIFTYGQTGTGKTYSMEGPPEDPGIAPRALQSLFREMGTGGQHRVTLSMVEIYNEAVRSGAPGASRLAPSPNPFCLHPQAPQRSPALSHQGPPCPRASPAPGSEAGPSRPGGSPGGWPHPLGRAQPGVSAPGEAAQWGPAALQAPALTRTGGAGPAAGQPLSARPADAEPGEEQPGHRRHSHEPAQLSLARPGHADTAHSVPIARSWHRRHAAPRRPGGVRARLEGGGGRHIAGRPRRRPASTGGSDHQPLAAGAGRRDGRAAGPPAPRALPRLAAHTPTAAGAGPRRHGGAAAADLHAARGSRRDRVLAQVRRACEPSGVGAGQAPQGSPLRDTLLLEHRHTTLRDPLHPHDVARQPSKPRLRQRLQLGPGTAGGPAFLVLPKEPGSHLCGQRQQNPYSLMTSLISGDRCPPRQSPPSSPTLEECSAWGNDHTSPAPLSPSAVIAAHSRGSQGRRCRPRPSGHQSHYPITTLDLD
ncbi:kinesin-like protein KIFC2 isoform X10 [Cervus canadensis]|uniref:kinesin-like protein KIFC2 isoform X10 n=1 Tax=Cervus canadensis TaxID=1574408 RepID=UPI001C9E1F38|nr:kinesin-like protein KIFC2 isoform X10 [Cervus canadensis]XP_043340197.1 kinesin-like protein KIFC2 isoform X10 [Cervus canadensis]XP_043340198.1 kinesin-like protein KIFC2 isoform X10 [Cervus canadensis]